MEKLYLYTSTYELVLMEAALTHLLEVSDTGEEYDEMLEERGEPLFYTLAEAHRAAIRKVMLTRDIFEGPST